MNDDESKSALCEKLWNDYNINTTNLSPEVERELNAVGVTDAAINELDNETIIVKFSCKLFDENVKKMEFTSHYFHAKTNKEFTPSIAIGTGGISVSVSGNSSISYTEMDRNPKLYFTFK